MYIMEDLFPISETVSTINELKRMATKTGYELLKELDSTENSKWEDNLYVGLQIATSESLTAGLMFSTLVDIPNYGYLKYGCFGVYDTDAKRVFNGVQVDDVYTHECAGQMAIGILKNSNASLAISVTGNAMPLNNHANMLGEVFIGIAGYNHNNKIIYTTKSINACLETNNNKFKKLCKRWYNTIVSDDTLKTYNSRNVTSSISQEIRYYTTYAALNECLEFIKNNKLKVPQFVIDRKRKDNITNKNNTHIQIPKNKFSNGGNGICMNKLCYYSGIRQENNINLYKNKTRKNKY